MGFWNRWREKTPVEVETLMREFYAAHHSRSFLPGDSRLDLDVVLFNTQPLVYRERGSFVFTEEWDKGDRRFGEEVHECYFGWKLWGKQEAPEDHHLFRLAVFYGRFSLTLPWVTTGIR